MPEETARNSRVRWIVSLLVAIALALGFGGGIIFAQAGGGAMFNVCATTLVPPGGPPVPVPGGAVTIPAGGVIAPGTPCAAGDTCKTSGAACGAFNLWKCTDVYVTRTGVCSCECQ